MIFLIKILWLYGYRFGEFITTSYLFYYRSTTHDGDGDGAGAWILVKILQVFVIWRHEINQIKSNPEILTQG